MADDTLGAYNIEDLRQMAKKRLPRGIFEYVDRGAEDDIAVRNNRDAYTGLKIKNRVLVDVSKRSTATEIFGRKIAMPYAISPTASAGLMSFGGELGLAKAAVRMGVPCTAGTDALTPMEELWEGAGGNLWFQLYMWGDKEMSMRFVERVRDTGYETLIVTVDGPVGSNREYNKKNGFSMPLIFRPRLFAQLSVRPGWCARVMARHLLAHGMFRKANYPPELASKITDSNFAYAYTKADSQCWDDIQRIRDMWPGNLLIKGLYNAEDAVIAAERGLQGVVLSNHGGRYIDRAPAPVQLVPEVRRAVGDRIKILVDSGIRRGSDIVKALALGADMVMAGRPTLWGSAVAGEAGSYRALEIFQTEMDRVMAQLGLNSVDEIGPHIFWNPPDWVPRAETPLKVVAE